MESDVYEGEDGVVRGTCGLLCMILVPNGQETDSTAMSLNLSCAELAVLGDSEGVLAQERI